MPHQKLPLFLCSLCLSLKDKTHYSIEIYKAKKTKYIHLTSRIDPEPYYQIIDSIVVREHISYPISLDFVQQKSSEYDYILSR